MAGAVFTDFWDARIESGGRIVFTASTSAGVGVFVATPQPVSVPVLNEVALLCFAAVMAVSSVALLYRRKET
jgi:hypothetical protein